jgi:O-antigen/teichoic acid export membrane protein
MLLWMLPGVFFLALTSIVSQYLAASGFPRIVVGIWLVTFIILVTASLFLIPSLGGVGAAVSISLTYMLLFIMIVAAAFRLEAATAKEQNT